MLQQHPTRWWLTVAAVATALTVAGCGDVTRDLDGTGAVGPDEVVSGAVTVLQVQLEYPLDGVYEVGEDARLYLGIANDGTEDDALLDVRGPDFADAVLTVDAEGVEAVPVPADDTVYVGAEGAPSVLLRELRTPLRSSQSVAVTLVFEDAGEVTVDAVVAAEGQTPTPPFDFPDPAEDPTS
ncbi:copper chaperone PCu(A)C [Geodermatophilus sp. SYSU D00079]